MPAAPCSDLRLHDNPLLQIANAPKATTHVLPIFVFDDRVVDCSALPGWKGERGEATSRVLGTARCGANRTKYVRPSGCLCWHTLLMIEAS